MTRCGICGKTYDDSKAISSGLQLCLRCIREHPRESLEVARKAHAESRALFRLPAAPPRDPQGIPCTICGNECRIPPNKFGYCGLRRNRSGTLVGGSAGQGKLSWYHDPLPTNCVADWVCPGGTGAGYPDFANCQGAERGYKNRAVFFQACSFDCLACQNWHFRQEVFSARTCTAEQLAEAVDERTSCICYFGGDPAPQLPFSLNVSRLARRRNRGRILRICWETNGSMNGGLLDEMVELAIESGGCIKFDLKAWDETLHFALAGVSNRRTLENFARVGGYLDRRREPPLLVASTLLVPGYIDAQEVAMLARFIASVDPQIPYCLLAFHPDFALSDLRPTPRLQAEECLNAARAAGLTRIRLGNRHLLS
jgi:pyruvate formate lyase activating enzyme